MPTEAQQARLAKNEAFFREVNERIRDVGVRLAVAADEEYEFVCECPDPTCVERVRLALAAYEAVRSSPRRFVIAPGHDVEAIENVVAVEDGSAVVEKAGVAGEVAAELDPRA